MLNNAGYTINKKKLTPDLLKELQENLTVTPDVNSDYQKNIEPFPVYKETNDTITVPRYYGIEKLGKPKSVFKPTKTSFNFIQPTED